MTSTAGLLEDAFGRVRETVHGSISGLTAQQLAHRPAHEANTIAWLVWHLTRIQDDHVAGVAGIEQVWTAQGFLRRFALPFDDAATGYAHSAADVGAVHPSSPAILLDYFDATHAQTLAYVRGLTDADLDRVVDPHWNPPVTLGVRLISVVNDDLQHAGQVAYIAGLITHA